MRAVSSGVTPCGEASSRRLPGSMPAGYVSHTGYQYDSISLVAGQRELAPPSKFLKLGGFNRSVFITEVNGTPHSQGNQPQKAQKLKNNFVTLVPFCG